MHIPLGPIGSALSRLRTYSIAALLGAISSTGSLASPLADRFVREYAASYSEAISKLEPVQGKIEVTVTPKSGDKRQLEVAFSMDHGMWKAVLTKAAEGIPGSSIVCVGRDREFVLYREDNDEDYSILDIRRPDSVRPRDQTYNEVKYYAWASHALMGVPIVEIMKEPGFRILKAVPVEVDGHKCIQIDFETTGNRYPHKGSLCLDPQEKWIVRKATAYNRKAINKGVDIRIEYPTNTSILKMPTTVTIEYPDRVGFATFTERHSKKTPVEEFTLQHYGLTDAGWDYDQDLSRQPGKRWTLWFTLAAVLVLTFITIVKHRRRMNHPS